MIGDEKKLATMPITLLSCKVGYGEDNDDDDDGENDNDNDNNRRRSDDRLISYTDDDWFGDDGSTTGS